MKNHSTVNWWLPEGPDFSEVAYAASPRCGSTSLTVHFKQVPYATSCLPEEALRIPRRVLIIRHPIERLKSAFAFFRNLGLVENNWRTFVDSVLDGTREMHTIPQYELNHENNVYVPTEHVQLKHLDQEIPGIGHDNHVKPASPQKPAYRIDELNALYKDDLSLSEWL